LVYIPCSDKKEALNIARKLVEEKLIACGNIINEVTSIFRWEDKIDESMECLLICKTKKSLFENIKERVQELHSYDCPCIISLPIDKGNEAYFNWISDNTI